MTGPAAFKVLVVDDDDANRYYKAHVLAKRGYQVREAGSGADALRLVDGERPALVLLDIKLPDASGFDVCGAIKAKQPGTIVLQTSAAFTAGRHRAAGLAGGADSYLVEPIEPDELLATVDALLRLHRAEQELRTVNDALEQRVAERTRELVESNRRLAEESERRVRAEETLRHAEKLDAVGQLTGGIAHDFNNLLTVVIGNLEMIEQELAGLGPESRDKVGRLAAGARRAGEDCERLTRRLLAFARHDVLRVHAVCVDEVVGGFERLLRRALGERVGFVSSLAAPASHCLLDTGQFEAALLNLALNARDAMPLGGELRLSTRGVEMRSAEDLGPAHILVIAPPKPGEYVHVAVTDTGSGMSGAVLARAFEPFFTTKDVGQGTGLGLSQVYGFIRQSGGLLTVETAPGAGTTVNLYLPCTESSAGAMPKTTAADDVPGGSETILIVEDNEMVLDYAVATLAQLGYRVLLAANARAALDIIANGERIDLLFTDIVLPKRMSGAELAREARRLRPTLRVLLTTGYAGLATGQAGEAEFPVISKPYRLGELARRIREVLAAA